MIRNPEEGPALGTLLRKTLATGMGALQNRGELFAVEMQEEKGRLITLFILAMATLFLALMTALLITGALIFAVPEDYRLYAVGGFALLYFLGTIGAIVGLRSLLQKIPFGDTLAEFKKDRDVLEAFSE